MGAQIGPSLVAVLVHGTWSPEAPWTRPGSQFRTRLEESLGGSIEFIPFKWSGVNSHAHRLEAAANLRNALKQNVDRYPNASHFVIAHSHGGNVACYALQDDGLRRAVRGVICIGTPFLHVQRSPLPRSLLSATVATLAIFLPLAIAYLFRAPEDPLTMYFAIGVIALAIPVIALLLWALLRKRESRLRWNDFLRPKRSPAEFTRALAFPTLGAERLLAVRITGDEAAGGITASQFFVWLFRRAWSHVAPVWDRIDQLHRWVAPFLGFTVAAAAAAGWLAIGPQDAAEAVRVIVVAFLLLFGLVGVVVGLTGYGLLVLLCLMHVPVGLDAMLASLDLQTTAEPTPPGEATIYHVAPRHDSSLTGGLSHSAIYDDPEVIRFIASWVRVRIESDTFEGRRTAIDANTADVIRQIRRHIQTHPHAADTCEGIHQWWLGAGTASSEAVQAAIDFLVSTGELTDLRNADGSVIYSQRAA